MHSSNKIEQCNQISNLETNFVTMIILFRRRVILEITREIKDFSLSIIGKAGCLFWKQKTKNHSIIYIISDKIEKIPDWFKN